MNALLYWDRNDICHNHFLQVSMMDQTDKITWLVLLICPNPNNFHWILMLKYTFQPIIEILSLNKGVKCLGCKMEVTQDYEKQCECDLDSGNN